MIERHRVRRLVLQSLCCLDVQGEHVSDLVDDFIGDADENLDTIVAARDLLRDAWAQRPQCDELLTRHAHKWELSRLAMVDRNILRLAVHEMLTSRAPARVVVNEAISLSNEFCAAESARFINGILDAVARELGKNI